MKRTSIFLVAVAMLLAACGAGTPGDGGMGMGMGNGMSARHHAAIPAAYAGLSAPGATDPAALERGGDLYTTYCVACHGESGMGEGAAGQALDPPASPVAHVSQMQADDYLFWRISEGGAPFGTAMPAWKDSLSEQQRWEVIAYIRALGRDGGEALLAQQAARQDEMLAQAVADGVITAVQADTFRLVHDLLEAQMRSGQPGGTMDEREAAALQALVDSGQITSAQADEFRDVHQALDLGGYMP